jgi:hypothetical protein
LFLQFFNVIKCYHFPLLIQDLTLKFFNHNVKVLMCRSPVSHNLHSLFRIHRTPEFRAWGPKTLENCNVLYTLCVWCLCRVVLHSWNNFINLRIQNSIQTSLISTQNIYKQKEV